MDLKKSLIVGQEWNIRVFEYNSEQERRDEMPSNHETFWENDSFAFVGHSAVKKFPKTSYKEVKNLGKTVYAVDPSTETIEGDKAYPDLTSIPTPVSAVVLEVPKGETKGWVQRAADAGVKELWIHMATETPDALALAKEKGMNVRSGTCAVMYVKPGFSYHSFHKWIMFLFGKY